jgi:hypothetical protein
MNSTLSMAPVTFVSNFLMTQVESWFIPLDILGIILLVTAIILAIIFLFIIVLDERCHTSSMILTANICLTEIVCSSNTLAMSIFTLQNDLQQIQYQDSLCIVRGYLSYATCALHNYSYLLSAIYRYMAIVHSTRLVWQSTRRQLLLIGLSWIIAFVFPIPFLFINSIKYNVDNQICQVPLRFSFSIVYAPHCVYIIPVALVMFIYFKLVRYVKEMGKRVTRVNTLSRAQRDLQIVRRTVILIMVLLISGLPYSSFIFLSFANRAPQYHFRIAYVFINFSLAAVMIALFKFTDRLRASVKKIINGRPNMSLRVMTEMHDQI